VVLAYFMDRFKENSWIYAKHQSSAKMQKYQIKLLAISAQIIACYP
jgi:hypothetical protein